MRVKLRCFQASTRIHKSHVQNKSNSLWMNAFIPTYRLMNVTWRPHWWRHEWVLSTPWYVFVLSPSFFSVLCLFIAFLCFCGFSSFMAYNYKSHSHLPQHFSPTLKKLKKKNTISKCVKSTIKGTEKEKKKRVLDLCCSSCWRKEWKMFIFLRNFNRNHHCRWLLVVYARLPKWKEEL